VYENLEENIETLQSNVGHIERKIARLNEITAEADKIDKQKEREREDFSLIYQSNAGCKAINREARYYYRNVGSGGYVSKSDVIGEYKKAHGDDVFNHGNKNVISKIKSLCSDLAGLVKKSAESFYTPTEWNKTTYRGQGMTPEGIRKLITQFNSDESNKTETVYKVGQFFSTSLHKNIAEDFANRSKDAVKVIFEVKGNSGHGVTAQYGLQFEGHEDEELYSPLAKFKVTDISKTMSNTYHVKLEEVTDVVSERLLPY
jgi:translation initiation factor 1 (eIF-1/SUI1)